MEQLPQIDMSQWTEVGDTWIQLGAREKVLSALPPKVLELVSEIEVFSGVDIGFRDKSLLIAAGQKDVGVESLYATHTHAYISVPDLDNVNASAVTHELLHLRRYWLNQIPQMDSKTHTTPNVEIAASIDNCLEHLAIVPQEYEFGFDPSAYWNEDLRRFWSGYPWPDLDKMSRRMHSLLGWVSTDLMSDGVLIETIRTKLRTDKMLDEAEKFRLRLTALSNSKPRTVAAALRFLKIPSNQVELVVLDIRNRRSVRNQVPNH